MTILYSLVIPLKNEEDNIRTLIEEIEAIMTQLGEPWELICIDDGSTDHTLKYLKELCKIKSYLRVLVFSKNFGQSSGFDAGFKAARGKFIITLDGDCQNDPADIPKLIKEISDCDLVSGQRLRRQDPWTKKIISFLANRIRGRLCGDGVKDTGCSLKIYRADCLKQIKMYQGMHRFIPALFKIEGFRIKEIPVNHRQRMKGKTKYNFFNRSFNTIADLFAVRWMKKRKLQYHIEKEIP